MFCALATMYTWWLLWYKRCRNHLLYHDATVKMTMTIMMMKHAVIQTVSESHFHWTKKKSDFNIFTSIYTDLFTLQSFSSNILLTSTEACGWFICIESEILWMFGWQWGKLWHWWLAQLSTFPLGQFISIYFMSSHLSNLQF